MPLFVAGRGLVELGSDSERLHDDADIHRTFKYREHNVQLPTVVTFVGRKAAPEFALLVAVVRHHRQRRNEVWAFSCEMASGKVRMPGAPSRADLTSLKKLAGGTLKTFKRI